MIQWKMWEMVYKLQGAMQCTASDDSRGLQESKESTQSHHSIPWELDVQCRKTVEKNPTSSPLSLGLTKQQRKNKQWGKGRKMSFLKGIGQTFIPPTGQWALRGYTHWQVSFLRQEPRSGNLEVCCWSIPTGKVTWQQAGAICGSVIYGEATFSDNLKVNSPFETYVLDP